jgi:Spy/CpxP family protein refolding chaperone
MMGGPIILRSFRELELTPAQQQHVHTVLSNARAHFAAKAATGAPPDMLALANPGDPGYASAVQAAKKRATDRIQQQSELNQQLYNVLTADQKAQLGKLVANWKARMAQRTDGVRGPPAPASR